MENKDVKILLNKCKSLLGNNIRREVKNYFEKSSNVSLVEGLQIKNKTFFFLLHNRNIHYRRHTNPLEKEIRKAAGLDV